MIDTGLYYDYELVALRLNALMTGRKAKAPKNESIDIKDTEFDQYDKAEHKQKLKDIQLAKDSLQRRRNETVRRKKYGL
jgi:hypothetical protein